MKGLHILEYLQKDASAFNIDDFLVMIGREPLLSQEEEHPLIVQAQQGDAEAMVRLLTANMRFVVALARQYSSNQAPLQRLIQTGVSGLEQVIKEFDPASGQHLFKFAVPALREALFRCVQSYAPESPKRETRSGVRQLKLVRISYTLPKIDEYLSGQPFVLEDFLLTASVVKNLVDEDEEYLIDEVLSTADGRHTIFAHRFYEQFTEDVIKRDVARYGIPVEDQDFEDNDRFEILCQKVVSRRQDESREMSELKWLYAPYIVKIAQEYAGQEVPLEKLIACGLKAFGEALKQYDTSESQNVLTSELQNVLTSEPHPLLTFATPQIREAMQRLVGQ
jgi:DNA-directed RNA polymerase specialized sigma subunit